MKKFIAAFAATVFLALGGAGFVDGHSSPLAAPVAALAPEDAQAACAAHWLGHYGWREYGVILPIEPYYMYPPFTHGKCISPIGVWCPNLECWHLFVGSNGGCGSGSYECQYKNPKAPRRLMRGTYRFE